MADSIMIRGSDGVKEWFDGLRSPGGALAKTTEPVAETMGHAMRGSLEGAGIGALVGIVQAVMPGKVGPGVLGMGAVAAMALGGYTGSRSAANAGVALSALAARDFAEGKAAAKAGTANAVVQAKVASLAAHGDQVGGPGNGAEDPLLNAGRAFSAAR